MPRAECFELESVIDVDYSFLDLVLVRRQTFQDLISSSISAVVYLDEAILFITSLQIEVTGGL